ncbi:uncharacterized protein LOC127258943 [Andrographis paniculata]|uniref:uncharacterized protein LOC127258943 n=1 Tax=Andrographis paniculata TaxID=175694 RepID=UPI0021E97C4F|nr:uncharacterized protein LOC127258943 [Andrographis paniculata]XP_051141989.1 uncharacterized protein LOC127258943 [Andrographis paniculata]XP_051141990.1 uncharacterized protein LOC127258943 [Andrographis paniculata]
MLGISYGELFLILGATAALIGPKDLPIIARTAGRLAGRAIGYVQVARGQFDSVMQQSQARQVHKELQDTMAQLEAIRHEIRSISFINPGPLTTRLVDNIANQAPVTNVDKETSKPPQESRDKIDSTEATNTDTAMGYSSSTSPLSDMHSQATEYARLAESMPLTSHSMDEVLNELKDASGQFVVLPISAESAKLLPGGPGRRDDLKGSDILLEAMLEEDVAHKAKGFFSEAPNQ